MTERQMDQGDDDDTVGSYDGEGEHPGQRVGKGAERGRLCMCCMSGQGRIERERGMETRCNVGPSISYRDRQGEPRQQ